MPTQQFSSRSQATRVTDAVTFRGAAGGGTLNRLGADRASDVVVAGTAHLVGWLDLQGRETDKILL